MSLLNFYKKLPPNERATPKRRLSYYQWGTFLSATPGYGIYYVCRLSLNVVKKPIVGDAALQNHINTIQTKRFRELADFWNGTNRETDFSQSRNPQKEKHRTNGTLSDVFCIFEKNFRKLPKRNSSIDSNETQ